MAKDSWWDSLPSVNEKKTANCSIKERAKQVGFDPVYLLDTKKGLFPFTFTSLMASESYDSEYIVTNFSQLEEVQKEKKDGSTYSFYEYEFINIKNVCTGAIYTFHKNSKLSQLLYRGDISKAIPFRLLFDGWTCFTPKRIDGETNDIKAGYKLPSLDYPFLDYEVYAKTTVVPSLDINAGISSKEGNSYIKRFLLNTISFKLGEELRVRDIEGFLYQKYKHECAAEGEKAGSTEDLYNTLLDIIQELRIKSVCKLGTAKDKVLLTQAKDEPLVDCYGRTVVPFVDNEGETMVYCPYDNHIILPNRRNKPQFEFPGIDVIKNLTIHIDVRDGSAKSEGDTLDYLNSLSNSKAVSRFVKGKQFWNKWLKDTHKETAA